ncbi:LysR family transcriptional regulator [Streptomyces endophytica]|uniref:LysR family transcriptional regulator n=1 Tax=Streptomyces endophytica TaxID=2991496 RepID=A0ABY6P9U4_9ACTN|nr:LysR family transcriptional regulator [Streptomyces endophytica]UZJ30593.1 LysR family transcriptional regulator [Streptomyces endophytica]
MDTRYLRAFVAVAEHGGISAAAQQLGYAQSSVSAQLKRLEAELGATVLTRGGTGAALTDAGRRLLPHAREALVLEDRMRRAALGDRPGCGSVPRSRWPTPGCRRCWRRWSTARAAPARAPTSS